MEQFLNQYKNEVKKFDEGETIFKFGKHKGKTYREVFETDKPYVAWLFQSMTDAKSARMLNYFRNRVEEEYRLHIDPKDQKTTD